MTLFVCSVQQFVSDLFPSFSKDAYDINALFLKYLIFSGFLVTIIGGVMVTAIVRFRAKKQPKEPDQISGHKNLEIIWTIMPFVVITFFFILTLQTLRAINKPVPKGEKPDIVIIARQWWCDMRYPNYKVAAANELHIPVGKKLLMQIESGDVVHDWWVQSLGPKIDAIPGQTNYAWISADKPGVYLGACAEFCGAEHAWMRIRVVAEPQADFDRWIQEQRQVAEIADDSVSQEGAMLFARKTCLGCHTVSANPDGTHIGPDLSHLGSRQTLLSGMMPNTNENLTRWLENPQKVKEGALMPDFMLNKDEVKALATYLEGLK